MKSIDYKNKLINVLKKEFPLISDFYVKCKRYDHEKDERNRLNGRYICKDRMIEFSLGMYYDIKTGRNLHFSIESNHPSAYFAAILLQSNQYEQNQKSVTNLCK
jgi:hypothetical protein